VTFSPYNLARTALSTPSLSKFPLKHSLHVTFLECLSERRVNVRWETKKLKSWKRYRVGRNTIKEKEEK
jgi:hypothetical protein